MNPDTRAELIARIRHCNRPLEPIPTGHPVDLRPLPGIRAVLFDVYGTLLVSASGDVGSAHETTRAEALRAALEEAGLIAPGGTLPPAHGLLERIILDHHARARNEGIEYPEVDILAVWSDALAALGLPPATPRDLQRLAVAYECATNPVWPMPGMVDVLNELHHTPLPLGIVSNAQFYTPLALEALTGRGLPELGFDPGLCAWSWQLREAKPSTRLFQVVLRRLERRLNISPHQVLYVGNDRLNDIWPARRLGMQTVLFAGDRRSLRLREGDPRVAGEPPDRTVDMLSQITVLLEPA